jgi:hypothetical protein
MSETAEENRTYEVRFYLTRAFADAVRLKQGGADIAPLQDVLSRHGATLENQLDEFQEQIRRWQEIENWEALFPDPQQRENERWFEKFTLETVLNDRKREYLSREFTLVVGDKKFFSGHEADALIADIEALGPAVIGTGPRIKEPVTRKVYSDNGGPHERATGIIPERKP